MSLALATKGIIGDFILSYPVYVPVEEPDLSTEEIGFSDIVIKELKPRIKTEQESQ